MYNMETEGTETQDDVEQLIPHIVMDRDGEEMESEVPVQELKIGSRFRDYESLMQSLEKYSLDNNYVYTTVHSKSIASIYNKINPRPRRVYSTKLKMCYMMLGCKHYGKIKPSGKGIRPNQKSYKSNCPSYIEVKADHDAEQLVVTRFVEDHNHVTGPEMAQFYPERRRLTKREVEIFREQLGSVDVSPALLQDYVRSTTRKAVSSKDIYNLRAKLRSPTKVPKKVAVPEADLPRPVRIPIVRKVEPREVEVCEDDHAYAEVSTDEARDWEATEYVPEFLDEREVEYEQDEGTTPENVMQVEKVNEAWKCVYMVLEEENKGLKSENKGLKVENKRLSEEIKRLQSVKPARNSACYKCSKSLLKDILSKARPTKTANSAAVDQLLRSVTSEEKPDGMVVEEG